MTLVFIQIRRKLNVGAVVLLKTNELFVKVDLGRKFLTRFMRVSLGIMIAYLSVCSGEWLVCLVNVVHRGFYYAAVTRRQVLVCLACCSVTSDLVKLLIVILQHLNGLCRNELGFWLHIEIDCNRL